MATKSKPAPKADETPATRNVENADQRIPAGPSVKRYPVGG